MTRLYISSFDLSISNFLNNCLRPGPFQKINSEEIEQELGDMFRTMYKLTKIFNDQPGPRNVSDRLRNKIDKFRQHQPLLNVICNPGIRDRHWEQVTRSNRQHWPRLHCCCPSFSGSSESLIEKYLPTYCAMCTD